MLTLTKGVRDYAALTGPKWMGQHTSKQKPTPMDPECSD
jgi:hypothetical protein